MRNCIACRNSIDPDDRVVEVLAKLVDVIGGQDVKTPVTRYIHEDEPIPTMVP